MNQVYPAAYFFDTSGLLPRYFRSAQGHTYITAICAPERGNVLGIAEITEVELTSALHQMSRGGVLKARRREAALSAFWAQVERSEYSIIAITTPVVRSAADLCERHPLKGYDAVQLACALAYRDNLRRLDPAPADFVFLSEDTKLLQAAVGEGFTVDNPAAHTL